MRRARRRPARGGGGGAEAVAAPDGLPHREQNASLSRWLRPQLVQNTLKGYHSRRVYDAGVRALLQRVSRATVTVDAAPTGSIGPGLVVLLGVGRGDAPADADYLAEKTAALRIFPDGQRRMNRSVLEAGGSVLVVSQFTLYGDCRKGRRPSFDQAAPPELAQALYEHFVAKLRALGLRVETGVFQALMQVELVNDGPVTLLLDSKKSF